MVNKNRHVIFTHLICFATIDITITKPHIPQIIRLPDNLIRRLQRERHTIVTGPASSVRQAKLDGLLELQSVRAAHDEGTEESFAAVRVRERRLLRILTDFKKYLLFNVFW